MFVTTTKLKTVNDIDDKSRLEFGNAIFILSAKQATKKL